MAKLYVITEPAGVGKSTISRKIAKASSKSALIEVTIFIRRSSDAMDSKILSVA